MPFSNGAPIVGKEVCNGIRIIRRDVRLERRGDRQPVVNGYLGLC